MRNKTKADLIGYGALVFIIMWWSIGLMPTVEDQKLERALRDATLCPNSHSVTVNGEWVGCTDDGHEAGNMYIPNHDYKDISLVPMKPYDDSWMDKP